MMENHAAEGEKYCKKTLFAVVLTS